MTKKQYGEEEWQHEMLMQPIWTGQEVEDMLCGYDPNVGHRSINDKMREAKEIVRRAVKAKLLIPVGETPSDTAFLMYGPGHDFFPMEVTVWVKESGCYPKFPFEPEDIENGQRPETSQDKLDESEYWLGLKQKVSEAIEKYPAWRKDNPNANKSGGLTDWLRVKIGANTREVEIIKSVLTDIFEDL